MKAAYIEQTGGPEVLRFGDRPIPEPAKGEVLVKLAASGVNSSLRRCWCAFPNASLSVRPRPRCCKA